MTTPIPTTEAVDRLARTIWQGAIRTAAWDDDPWEDQREGVKYSIRAKALDLLVAVYPQIVEDILDWAANLLIDDDESRYGEAAELLQYRAREVQS